MGQPGFFDLDERYQWLSEDGDPLVKLAALIDFEVFRPKLATALKRSDGSKGGRPPYDPVLMFKILVLQTLYTLSDDATEFQIRDRLSFMRFLGLGFEDAVPDAKTVWLFREYLTRAGAIEDLFAAFDAWLKGKGYLAMSGGASLRLRQAKPVGEAGGGQIIDASIIAAPRQRNTDAEKAVLKEGRIPEAWAANPKKLAQKDRDARWTLKRAKARAAKTDGAKAKVEIAIPVFGYKTHVSIDRKHGFVRRFAVTSAAAHDGAQLAHVLDPANTASDVWADTAYRSKTNEAYLAKSTKPGQSQPQFRPKPRVKSLVELNGWLEDQCIAYAKRTRHPEFKDRTIWDMFQDERASLMEQRGPFDGFVEKAVRAATTCLIMADHNRYSVDARAAGRMVLVRSHAERITVLLDDETVADHPRSFRRDQVIYDPWHYLPVLLKKPGALRNGAPFKDWDLPPALAQVRAKLKSHTDGDRQFVTVLGAVLDHGLDAVEAACAEALTAGLASAAVILTVVARQRQPAEPPSITTPPPASPTGFACRSLKLAPPDALRLKIEPSADCGRYDSLRRVA